MADPAKNTTQQDQRSLARLAAVQALYQMEHSGKGVNAIIKEFQDHRLGGELDGQAIRDADDAFFTDIVEGVIEAQLKIDPFIERSLKKGWTLKRLDATARAILRAGIFELIRRPDVPVKVVIDEYVDLTNAFFEEGESEPSFVNGVLDSAAKDVRSEELS